MGWSALLQGIFLTQGSNPSLLCLLHRQVDSVQLVPPGKGYFPRQPYNFGKWLFKIIFSGTPQYWETRVFPSFHSSLLWPKDFDVSIVYLDCKCLERRWIRLFFNFNTNQMYPFIFIERINDWMKVPHMWHLGIHSYDKLLNSTNI